MLIGLLMELSAQLRTKEVAKPTTPSPLSELLRVPTTYGTETLLSSPSNKLLIAPPLMETTVAATEEWTTLSCTSETEESTPGQTIHTSVLNNHAGLPQVSSELEDMEMLLAAQLCRVL